MLRPSTRPGPHRGAGPGAYSLLLRRICSFAGRRLSVDCASQTALGGSRSPTLTPLDLSGLGLEMVVRSGGRPFASIIVDFFSFGSDEGSKRLFFFLVGGFQIGGHKALSPWWLQFVWDAVRNRSFPSVINLIPSNIIALSKRTAPCKVCLSAAYCRPFRALGAGAVAE